MMIAETCPRNLIGSLLFLKKNIGSIFFKKSKLKMVKMKFFIELKKIRGWRKLMNLNGTEKWRRQNDK